MTACAKRSFASVRDARIAHKRASFRVRVYRCPDCHRLHATNHEKQKRRGDKFDG